MSVILTRSNSQGGRKTSLAAAGPYVQTLLARARGVLLEWEGPGETSLRREGRLVPGGRAGGELTVELVGSDAAGRPAAGAPVTLVLPTQDTLWRFATTARKLEAGRASETVSLDWPTEVVQESARRHERATFVLPVVATIPADGSGTIAIATYTLDMSVGGMQLVLPRLLPQGTEVQLAIRLPQETVTAGATVAWTRAIRDEPRDPMYGVGLRFAALAPRAATRLRTLLVTRGVTG